MYSVYRSIQVPQASFQGFRRGEAGSTVHTAGTPGRPADGLVWVLRRLNNIYNFNELCKWRIVARGYQIQSLEGGWHGYLHHIEGDKGFNKNGREYRESVEKVGKPIPARGHSPERPRHFWDRKFVCKPAYNFFHETTSMSGELVGKAIPQP